MVKKRRNEGQNTSTSARDSRNKHRSNGRGRAVNRKADSLSTAAMSRDRSRAALQLVMRLMVIPGPSGGEADLADEIRQRLIDAGAAPNSIEVDSAHKKIGQLPDRNTIGNTGNLIFKLPGTISGPRRMLTAHMDTVPICVGASPKRHGTHIRSAISDRGIGADDRAGVAVTLNAALQILKEQLPHPPLTFCWFVQEETGLHGSRCVARSKLGRPRLVFNFDGGSPVKMTIGATSGCRMTIDIEGVASHAGGAPERGVSAIAIAGLAIAELHRTGWHGLIQKKGKLGTSNVGVVQGGAATNVVTDHVRVRAEARSHDANFRKEIVARIRQAFTDAADKVVNTEGVAGRVHFNERLDYESFRLSTDDPSVVAAKQAIATLGLNPEPAIANGGVDANWLTAHGMPTVTLGCGQENPHMSSEALNIEEFQTACRIALILATAAETVTPTRAS